MITILKTLKIEYSGIDQPTEKDLVELALKSTDDKPTDVMNGSMCIETNTGKVFIFDEDSTTWTEIGGSSSVSK